MGTADARGQQAGNCADSFRVNPRKIINFLELQGLFDAHCGPAYSAVEGSPHLPRVCAAVNRRASPLLVDRASVAPASPTGLIHGQGNFRGTPKARARAA